MIPSTEPTGQAFLLPLYFFSQQVTLAISLPVRQAKDWLKVMVSVHGTFTMAGWCDLYGELQDWYVHLFCLECKCILGLGFEEIKPVVSSQPRTDVRRQLFSFSLFSSLNHKLPLFWRNQPLLIVFWVLQVWVFSFVVIHIDAARVDFVITAVNIAW